MKRSLFLTAVLALAGISALSAHDFWLVPEIFRVPEGWTVHVRGQTGMEFPGSEAAVSLDRIAEAKLVSARRTIEVERKARVGSSLLLEARPVGSGQWWVAVAREPRPIHLTAEQFNDYLAHEGLPHMLERRRTRGVLDQDADERHTKFAKAIVQVGEGGSRVFDRPVGHAIELVPIVDPFEPHPGDEFAARLLFHGRPLAGAVVFAGRADAGAGPTAQATTDEAGIARFLLYVPGRWYLKAIHMERAENEPEFDYESWWTTLTFDVASTPETAAAE